MVYLHQDYTILIIDANNIASDNLTFNSNLNVSGLTDLNGDISKNNITTLLGNQTTLLSSLNVSGSATLDKTTNINGSLYMSGLNVLETLNTHKTGLSTFCNFRSDNPNAMTLDDDVTVIHGILQDSEIQFKTVSNVLDCSTKIDIRMENYMCIAQGKRGRRP